MKSRRNIRFKSRRKIRSKSRHKIRSKSRRKIRSKFCSRIDGSGYYILSSMLSSIKTFIYLMYDIIRYTYENPGTIGKITTVIALIIGGFIYCQKDAKFKGYINQIKLVCNNEYEKIVTELVTELKLQDSNIVSKIKELFIQEDIDKYNEKIRSNKTKKKDKEEKLIKNLEYKTDLANNNNIFASLIFKAWNKKREYEISKLNTEINNINTELEKDEEVFNKTKNENIKYITNLTKEKDNIEQNHEDIDTLITKIRDKVNKIKENFISTDALRTSIDDEFIKRICKVKNEYDIINKEMCIYPTRDCYLNYLKKISIIVKYTLKSYPKNENENENLVRLEYIDKYIDECIEDIENNKVKNFIDVIDPKKWFNFHLQKLL